MRRSIDPKIRVLTDALNDIDGISTKWSCSGHPPPLGWAGLLLPMVELPYLSFYASAKQGRKIAQIIAKTPKLKYRWNIEVDFSICLHARYTIRLPGGVWHDALLYRAWPIWQDIERIAESVRAYPWNE